MIRIELKGNRCRVYFENLNRGVAPREYHYKFRNKILEKLNKVNPDLSKELHDSWDSYFTFSGLMGKLWNTPLGLQFRNIEVDFSSPNTSVIVSIRDALLLDPILLLDNCRLKVTRVEMETIVLPNSVSESHIVSLGEIVMKKPERDGKTEHVGADDDVESYLKNIILKQYMAYSGKSVPVDVKIDFIKQKKKAIIKDNGVSNSFLALRLKFSIKTDPDVMKFMLTQGIGHHRKLGFGMVRIEGSNSN